MWLAVWGFFAVFILGFVAWTVIVLHQQKKAWAAFAKRHKMTYEPGTFMGSPVVTGSYNKWRFSLYTGMQQTDDIRGQRYITVIEFQLGQGMPTGAAVATRDFLAFLDGLIFDQSYDPDLAEWSNEYILRTRDEENMRAYLTKERQQMLHSIFSMKGASVLFFFDELEAVLRIETSDPLRDPAHLERIVKRISDAVDVLAPTAEEKKRFKQLLEEEKKRRFAAAQQVADEEEDDDDEEEEIIIVKKKKPKGKKKKPSAKKPAQPDES